MEFNKYFILLRSSSIFFFHVKNNCNPIAIVLKTHTILCVICVDIPLIMCPTSEKMTFNTQVMCVIVVGGLLVGYTTQVFGFLIIETILLENVPRFPINFTFSNALIMPKCDFHNYDNLQLLS